MIEEAVDAVFVELGVRAEYQAKDGSITFVSVRREHVQATVPLLGTGVIMSPETQVGAMAALVRASEVALPAKGDRLVMPDGRSYWVNDTPEFNGFGVWRLPVMEAR